MCMRVCDIKVNDRKVNVRRCENEKNVKSGGMNVMRLRHCKLN